MKSTNPIRVAVVGLGNCASSLIQGIAHYRHAGVTQGLINDRIGPYCVGDLEFVLGFDIDARKVGKDIAEAVFAGPNNTTVFHPDIPLTGVSVLKGRVLDGVASHMTTGGERGFLVSGAAEPSERDVVDALVRSKADVLVNFLPVGSQQATEFYMDCALAAGVAVVNCIPVFITSDPAWEARFRERRLPIVGDDIKAQVGATIVHRTLANLFANRGVIVHRTYQLNTGGNTDFMNMLDRERLLDKKVSKTEAVQTALAQRLEEENILIGPSEYVPWQNDNKVCFLRIEGTQWGNVPFHLEMRLSVEDSPNAAACVADAIRCCKLARDRGEYGALTAPSAYLCKHPPQQFNDEVAGQMLDAFIAGLQAAG